MRETRLRPDLLLLISIFVLPGMQCDDQKKTKATMDNAFEQVRSDWLHRYQTAQERGDKLSMCTTAGSHSGAFRQAKDLANSKKWQNIAERDCKAAGLP